MVTIIEILNDHPVACYGDYEDPNKILELSIIVLEKEWIKENTININDVEFTIIKHKSTPVWVLGKVKTFQINGEKKEIFEVVFRIQLYDSKSDGDRIGYQNLYQVTTVMVDDNFRGWKIAKTMYQYLVKNKKITLLGDMYQYFGARKLWASLSKNTDIQVDIVDVVEGKVLFTNVTLHHGRYDDHFDTRLWSYGTEKENIRPILVDI